MNRPKKKKKTLRCPWCRSSSYIHPYYRDLRYACGSEPEKNVQSEICITVVSQVKNKIKNKLY